MLAPTVWVVAKYWNTAYFGLIFLRASTSHELFAGMRALLATSSSSGV
jgi:hypothetical protein